MVLEAYAALSTADFQLMPSLRLLDLGACPSDPCLIFPDNILYLKWMTQHATLLPSSLVVLDLSNSDGLVVLPEEVSVLSSLQMLNLQGCSRLVALPTGISGMSSLQALHLGQCASMAALPREISNLCSLETLSLSGCSTLAALPQELGSLSRLQTLDLSLCSDLSALPEEISSLLSVDREPSKPQHMWLLRQAQLRQPAQR